MQQDFAEKKNKKNKQAIIILNNFKNLNNYKIFSLRVLKKLSLFLKRQTKKIYNFFLLSTNNEARKLSFFDNYHTNN